MFKFLGHLFVTIGHAIATAFEKAKPFLEKEIPVVIQVLQGFKAGIDTVNASPFNNMVNQLLGTNLADIVKKVNDALPKAIVDLGLFNGVITADNAQAAITQALEFIKTVSPTARGIYIHDLGKLILADISNGTLDVKHSGAILQQAYEAGVHLELFPDLNKPIAESGDQNISSQDNKEQDPQGSPDSHQAAAIAKDESQGS